MPSYNVKDINGLKWKLRFIGVEKAHEWHKKMLAQCRCPNCGHFQSLFASHNYLEKYKPKRCRHCSMPNPLANIVNPLDNMVAQKKEEIGAIRQQ